MKPHLFTGPDLPAVLRTAAAALGEDVAIVRWRTVGSDADRRAEVIAVRGEEVERFRAVVDPGPLPGSAGSREVRGGAAPLKIALVGPTGAGKTTTVAKLALSPDAFGGRRVGLLTVDTFRVGAVEQIQMYADVAGLPLEVVYEAHEVPGALSRLRKCEVVIVDTPGRGPRASETEFEWRSMLSAIAPDEVHLVMPTTVRFDVADFVRLAYAPIGVTHALFTKLDELPIEPAIVGLAARLGLRSRWLTDGQAVPTDLKVALPRMLNSLGQFSHEDGRSAGHSGGISARHDGGVSALHCGGASARNESGVFGRHDGASAGNEGGAFGRHDGASARSRNPFAEAGPGAASAPSTAAHDAARTGFAAALAAARPKGAVA